MVKQLRSTAQVHNASSYLTEFTFSDLLLVSIYITELTGISYFPKHWSADQESRAR
jgi:response regulator of citrate/malate metabolism